MMMGASKVPRYRLVLTVQHTSPSAGATPFYAAGIQRFVSSKYGAASSSLVHSLEYYSRTSRAWRKQHRPHMVCSTCYVRRHSLRHVTYSQFRSSIVVVVKVVDIVLSSVSPLLRLHSFVVLTHVLMNSSSPPTLVSLVYVDGSRGG